MTLMQSLSNSNKFIPNTDKKSIYCKVSNICEPLITKHGIYSSIHMKAAGFHYTNQGDTVRCNDCKLEVSEWTKDMNPFTIHEQRSPMCTFVQSKCLPKPNDSIISSKDTESVDKSSSEDILTKHHRMENTPNTRSFCTLNELESLKQVRRRTFSHWPHRTTPSSHQMIQAGFFSCNVGDRVICLYCNKIFQQWTPYVDDPSEAHQAVSPNCPYIINMLTDSEVLKIPIVNEPSTKTNFSTANLPGSVLCDQLVKPEAYHTVYKEIPKRYASFNTWPNENMPSVDDLVRAGFFYTGTKSIVTCFYCNGSLQNWGPTDKPMIEHARWFPHCAYMRQLCGEKEYKKIQEYNQRRKEMMARKESDNQSEPVVGGPYNKQLQIPDENTLSRYVSARLDLPISQYMLKRNFKLSIVKRCWEDQLRLKRDDFVSETDLFIACTILQKQIDHINGQKQNIIIPSVIMSKIRQKEHSASEPVLVDMSNKNDVEMSTSADSHTTKDLTANNVEQKIETKSDNGNTDMQKDINNSSSSNPCALCLTEEKCLAFIPCGHVASCVPCGHSVKSCPICRAEIKASVRVYL